MNQAIRLKLFLMMVLQFFIWGAWLPLIFGYLPSLHFSPSQQSWILNAFPIAAIIGMFFSNQFADRNFAAERFLAFSHLVGGLAILGCAYTRDFWPFFGLMLVHCLLYVPTISITNSIAFANMKDAQKEFGLVRMGGTIGWILAAWPFTFILVDWAKVDAAHPSGLKDWLGTVLANGLSGEELQARTPWTFIVAGAASLALALFSLALPHTPPKKADKNTDSLAWMGAVRLLAHPFVLVLWLVTFIDAFVHNCYFNWTGTFLGKVGIPGNWIMPVMSIGQIAEILTMFALGGVLKRLGWRATMTIGILGHAARFAVFAFLPQYPALIVTVNVLHGICYAFFFATVYIFVDDYFPKDVRASAQGLFNVMILGAGALLANSLCPVLLQNVFTTNGVTDFRGLFLVPCLSAGAAAVALALFFHPPRKTAPSASVGGAPAH
ncbi:MAG: MFS transporter [Verrucomicrobia bacterium]|nr:MFS transporter [Verrucomicrobiota bacterium]MBI3868093.1 MFS transporter [Verrucomicrobiota bacterium]